VRVVALNDQGKPVEGLSSADITATAAGNPVAVLQLSSDAGSGPNAGGRSDSLLYLFPPMQANETAQRAKALSEPMSGLHNPSITIVTGDGAQVTGPEGSAQINAMIDRLTEKKVGVKSFAQWQPVAKKAIRAAARATGRCIVVLNDSTYHLSPNVVGYDMSSIGATAANLACELYVVEDAASMPSEFPPTFGEFKRGETEDASGQLQAIDGSIPSVPLSASGEQFTYSMKSALKDIERDAAGVYWAELAATSACQKSPGCSLQLTTSRKNVSLHFPMKLSPVGNRHGSATLSDLGK
jgi:hypothetical protein